MPLKFIPVKTRPILPPKDNLYPIFDASLPKLREGDIIFITLQSVVAPKNDLYSPLWKEFK
jgi:F420-0:gamma-glutamyl ligase